MPINKNEMDNKRREKRIFIRPKYNKLSQFEQKENESGSAYTRHEKKNIAERKVVIVLCKNKVFFTG